MTERSTVGIITRTKDRAVLLKRAIESVINQTYTDWALVLVNDGGDPTIVDDLVRHYTASASGRIRIVHNSQSLGMEGASKVGLDNIDAGLLIFHDDDDAWAPEFLMVTVHELRRLQRKYPSVQGVTTRVHRVFETIRGNLVEIDSVEPFHASVPQGFLSLDRILAGNFVPPITFLFTREAYQGVGSVYEAIPYLGDWDFLVRFLSRYDVYMIPQFLAFYHWRKDSQPGGISNTVFAEVSQHMMYRQSLLNAWLREDFAAGKTGIGTYANLRMHLEALRSQGEAVGNELKNIKAQAETQHNQLTNIRNQAETQQNQLTNIQNQAEIQRAQLVDILRQDEAHHRELASIRRLVESHGAEWSALRSNLLTLVPVAQEAAAAPLPQAIVDYYWYSLSWRAFRWFRSLGNRVMRLPPEKRPSVQSSEEAWRIAREIQESLSWNISAPLRWVGCMIHIVPWVRHAKSADSSHQAGSSGS